MELPEGLSAWIGSTRTDREVLSERTARELAALFDWNRAPGRGEALPPLWHWAMFPETARQSELGAEGHAQGSGFLPPAPLPRRMWAGSRLQFRRPLLIGREITRTSRILDITVKQGRRGPLVLIRVLRELKDGEAALLREEQDLIFREIDHLDRRTARGEGSPASVPELAPAERTWERQIIADPVLLFRYSAATFNGHRIHYDRDFTTLHEGYPGLLVHGPLIATFMVDLVRRNVHEATIENFSFRAISPLFDREPFLVCGQRNPNASEVNGSEVKVWAQNSAGHLCAYGSVSLAPPTDSRIPVNAQTGDT